MEGFLKRFEGFSQCKIKIAVIGKTTARCAEENNLKVDFISASPAANDFAKGLVKFLFKYKKNAC